MGVVPPVFAEGSQDSKNEPSEIHHRFDVGIERFGG